jgi:hypothetical protein
MEATVTIPLYEYKRLETIDKELDARTALISKLQYELENKNTYLVKIELHTRSAHGGTQRVTLDEYKFTAFDYIQTDESAKFRKWLLENEIKLKNYQTSVVEELDKLSVMYKSLSALSPFVKWLFNIKL